MPRNFTHLTAAAALVSASLLAAPSLAAGLPQEYWELDGNITSTASNDRPDWDEVYNGGITDMNPACTLIKQTVLIKDPAPQTIFRGGGSKDTRDVTTWSHTDGSVPDKNDTTHGGAVALNCDGDIFLFAFGLRYSNDGDSNNGIWLFQNDVAPITTGPDAGTFGPDAHADGDPLLVAGFSNGGVQANLGLFQWQGGQLVTDIDPASNEANCATSTEDLCGIANPDGSVDVPSGWGYTDKDGISNSAAPNAFWEIGANITELVGEVCATGFLTNTRSSTAPNAQLKDFLFGDFDICGIQVTIECSARGVDLGGDKYVYALKGTTTSLFSSSLNHKVFIDSNLNGSFDSGTDQKVFGPATVPVSPETYWPGPTSTEVVQFSTETNKPTIKAFAFADSAAGSSLSAENSTTCPKQQTSPNISVAMDCIACLGIDSGAVVAEVNAAWEVCNTGNVVLKNVDISDNDIALADFNPFYASIAPGVCQRGTVPARLPSTVGDGFADHAMFTSGLTVVYDVGLGGSVGLTNTDGSATCNLCFDPSGAPFTGDTEVPLNCPDPTPEP